MPYLGRILTDENGRQSRAAVYEFTVPISSLEGYDELLASVGEAGTPGAHNSLTNRDAADAHPLDAITDLPEHINNLSIHFSEASIVHNNIAGRDTAGAHPLSAITIDANLDMSGYAILDAISLEIDGTDGIDINPGSDTDADLITVGVSGSPTLFWDESEDKFVFTKDIDTPSGVGGGVTDHTLLSNIGTNSHATIDSHIADLGIHFGVGDISHTSIQDIGTNSHATIDSHIADSTIHFTEASIDHTNIQNIGTNTHAQIDTHIADTNNPHGGPEYVSGSDTLTGAGDTVAGSPTGDGTYTFKLQFDDDDHDYTLEFNMIRGFSKWMAVGMAVGTNVAKVGGATETRSYTWDDDQNAKFRVDGNIGANFSVEITARSSSIVVALTTGEANSDLGLIEWRGIDWGA